MDRAEYHKQWAKKNSEHVKEYQRVYRIVNSLRLKRQASDRYQQFKTSGKAKKYRENNKENIKVHKRKYYLKHKENISKKAKLTYKKNKSVYTDRAKRYRKDNEKAIKKAKKIDYLNNQQKVKDRTKKWRQQNKERALENDKRKSKKYVKELRDSYLKNLLIRKHKIPKSEITKDILEIQRTILKIKRYDKTKKTHRKPRRASLRLSGHLVQARKRGNGNLKSKSIRPNRNGNSKGVSH